MKLGDWTHIKVSEHEDPVTGHLTCTVTYDGKETVHGPFESREAMAQVMSAIMVDIIYGPAIEIDKQPTFGS